MADEAGPVATLPLRARSETGEGVEEAEELGDAAQKATEHLRPRPRGGGRPDVSSTRLRPSADQGLPRLTSGSWPHIKTF